MPSHPPHRLAVAGLLAWLLFPAACESPISVQHDSDPQADFTKFRSYAWISEEPLIGPEPGVGAAYVSPLDDQRIRRAVDARMAAKGFPKLPLGEADLVVSYTIGAEQKVRVRQTPGRSTVYYPGYGYGYGAWYGGSPVDVQTYTEGTLALQFFDSQTKQAVWVGWGSKRLSRSDDSEKVLTRAVDMILAPFPVRGTAPQRATP